MKKIKIFLGMSVILMGMSALTLFANSNEGLVYMETDEAGGPEIIYTKPVRGVIFSHKYHVKELGLSCDSCHSGLFEMQALKSQENPDFNMEALYKGKYCGACHDGKVAFASNTKCASCHIGVKGLKKFQQKLAQEK
ncbi:MAG: cytochrome c3 family protein, partial [Caldimicrobium sp.]